MLAVRPEGRRASPPDRPRLPVRWAAERAGRWAGAKRKPRGRSRPVDPALAARVRDATQRVTGFKSHVRGTTLEIDFKDERGLAELVEAP